jgi:hypothetical protein
MGSQGVREFKASRKRRIALRATANMLTGCLILGLVLLPPDVVRAGPQDVALAMMTSGTILAQPSESSSPPSKPTAKELLYQARLAMRDGRYDEAERTIRQAEEVGGPIDPLVGRFEDSPEKARRALAALREGGGGTASRPPEARSAGDVAPSRYSSATGNAPSEPDPRKAQAGTLLLGARQSLADGKPQAAAEQLGRVKQMQLTFAPQEDSPERVEALLKQFQRFAPGPRPGEDTATFQRQFAQFMLDQSEQLLVYGDLDSAERAASRARQLPVQYGAQERSPEKVLQAIARLREKREARGTLPQAIRRLAFPLPFPALGKELGRSRSADLLPKPAWSSIAAT